MKVTADIHVYHATSFQHLVGIFTISNMTTAVLNSCGFWLTYVFIELMKLSFMLFVAWANVSSFLQLAITYDFRYILLLRLSYPHSKKTKYNTSIKDIHFSFITNYDDTKIIKGCKIAVVLMISPVLCDYLQVMEC